MTLAPGSIALPDEVDIILVSKGRIAAVHGQFLDDPTPTDVITFEHGEILVCPEVALEQGPHYRRSVEEETLLYGIHGLLHLRGYDDHAADDRRAMVKAQEVVLRNVLKRVPA